MCSKNLIDCWLNEGLSLPLSDCLQLTQYFMFHWHSNHNNFFSELTHSENKQVDEMSFLSRSFSDEIKDQNRSKIIIIILFLREIIVSRCDLKGGILFVKRECFSSMNGQEEWKRLDMWHSAEGLVWIQGSLGIQCLRSSLVKRRVVCVCVCVCARLRERERNPRDVEKPAIFHEEHSCTIDHLVASLSRSTAPLFYCPHYIQFSKQETKHVPHPMAKSSTEVSVH